MDKNLYKINLKTVMIVLLPFFVVLIFYTLKFFNIESICLWKLIFHKPCIGCGMGHAIISILKLNFEEAINYNPLVIIVFPLLIYAWVKSIVKSLNNFNG